MSAVSSDQTLIRVADLPARKAHHFDIRLEEEALEALADELSILDLRKLRFQGTLQPQGKSAWALSADLGATAVQSCILTLAPVTTRIDTQVRRLFTSAYADTITGEETEMPEDETIEPLAPQIDLSAVIRESLGLALPDYPRAEGAELESAQFAAPGVTPMSDEDTKPFASLASLKEKLEKPDDT